MAEAAFSGLGKNTAAKGISERDVPHIRLIINLDIFSSPKDIYMFGKKLGHGSYGVVYEATHIRTQTQWAIKTVCKPGSTKIKMLEQEIKILKQVDHPHILRLEEIYETAQMTYLITELCVGGELKQVLQQKQFFPEEEARHIIGCLADAITYLHKKNIMHRDLKLENILVKNSLDDYNDDLLFSNQVADFGLSVKTLGVGSDNILSDICGTPVYMAPEMMSQRGYTHWCDMWSVGVIMYILLCGEPPFISKSKENRLKEIRTIGVQFSSPIWDTVSNAAKTVVTCLLKENPAYRMSANQLRDNPWITGDTSTPAMPLNALEMMHNFHEQEKSKTGVKPRPQSSVKSRKSQRKTNVNSVKKAASHQNGQRSPPSPLEV
uniref:Serine/threonine kinase 33 n=1 Tax=Hippocampus comes TaxID=109280 RepID=A0A3Q2XMH5_HIPCM